MHKHHVPDHGDGFGDVTHANIDARQTCASPVSVRRYDRLFRIEKYLKGQKLFRRQEKRSVDVQRTALSVAQSIKHSQLHWSVNVRS